MNSPIKQRSPKNIIKLILLVIITLTGLLIFSIELYKLLATPQPTTNQIKDSPNTQDPNPDVKRIILLIGDGFGTNHLNLALEYSDRQYNFTQCPNTTVDTDSMSSPKATDSAAAATAIATGHKVSNGVISQNIPGDGSNLETILEKASSYGMATGIITTTEITHATPASFASHTNSRNNFQKIFNQYLADDVLDILMGGMNSDVDTSLIEESKYTKITNSTELTNTRVDSKVIGIFDENGNIPFVKDRDETIPSLMEMADKSLDLLNTDPEGFFLMIEGGRIDHASHNNDVDTMLEEAVEFLDTINTVTDWVEGKENTIIIITSDHETGGLIYTKGDNVIDSLNSVAWSSSGHTNNKVPLYICGMTNTSLANVKHHIDTYQIMYQFLTSE